MNNSDELYQLIQLLSKAEKRRFKIISANSSGKVKSYVKLFDYLSTQEEYNEEQILKKFRNEAFIQHLSPTKSKLYINLLKSLATLNTGNPIDRELNEMIGFAEILYYKGLLKQSRRWLNKVKKLAYQYEDFSTLIQVFYWEKKILLELQSENLPETFDSIIEEENIILQKQNDLLQYRNFFYKVSSLFSKQYRVRNIAEKKILEEIASSPLLNKNKPKSISAQIVYHEVYHKYLLKTNKLEAARQELEMALKLFKKDGKKFIERDVETYLRINLNLINVCILINDLDSVEHTLMRLRKISESSGFHEVKTKEKLYYSQMLYYINSHQWEKGHQLAKEIKAYMEKHDFMFKKTKLLIIYYNIAMLYFIRQDYEESLHWLNRILYQPKTELRKDSQTIARIMRMLVLYELNNKDLLDDLIRSTQRHLSVNNYRYEFEQSLIGLLKDLISVANEGEVIERCIELENKIKEMSKNEKVKQIAQDEVLLWVKSKIQKKSMIDILAEERNIKKGQELSH